MKKIKILLAFLSRVNGNYEPLGIECLAGHLEKVFGRRVSVKMVIARNKRELEGLFKEITIWKPEILGLSLFFNTLDFYRETMDFVRGKSNPPRVILGNILATFNAEILLSEYPEVIVCKGSGELPMQEFVEYVMGKRKITDVSSIAYSHNGMPIFNKVISSPIGMPQRVFLKKIQRDPAGRIYLEASRGCPQRCAFCAQAKFFGSARVEKSEQALREEVLYLAKENITLLDFVDEDLLANNGKVAMQVAKVVCGLKEEGVLKKDAQMMCSLSARALLAPRGKEALQKLVFAGLRHCFVGIESFSKNQLNRLGKRHAPKEAVHAINVLRRNGVMYEIGSVIFEPETDLFDILQNCVGMRRAGAESVSNPLNQWRALKDTQMRHRLMKKELVRKPYDPNWLAFEWRYANAKVADIVYRAKNIESGLMLVESAIKRIYRSEMFFSLPQKSKGYILRCKLNFNSLLVDFLEEAVIAALNNKPIGNIAQQYELKAQIFLFALTQKNNPLVSIRKAAKQALDVKNKKTAYFAFPQDMPKKST